jgi:glycopeptide antibiotics resistance protein
MLRHWYYPFLRFRGTFEQLAVPFLALCAIALPCWLAFRWYRRRALGHPSSSGREILLLATVVYLVGLATVTLAPNRSSRVRAEGTGGIELHLNVASLACSSPNLPRGWNQGFCLDNAAGNVLLFVPLGILLPLVWRRLRFWQGMLIAMALSTIIELAQYLSSAWGSYRAADVNDIILNVVGACVGMSLVALLRLRDRSHPAVPRA